MINFKCPETINIIKKFHLNYNELVLQCVQVILLFFFFQTLNIGYKQRFYFKIIHDQFNNLYLKKIFHEIISMIDIYEFHFQRLTRMYFNSISNIEQYV